MSHGENLYDKQSINFLELIWGEGYLSPGGPEEVARLLTGVDLKEKNVLDIGCGAGGITLSLARDYHAAKVIGIDVEEPVCQTARNHINDAGFSDRVEIKKVTPGPFPFGDAEFDIVFSKDSIIHITDKESLAKQAYRILKPGGWFVASDWLISHDDEPTIEMQHYIELEGLEFAMASPQRYEKALSEAGFVNVSLLNRNPWYFEQAQQELAELSGPRRQEFEQAIGVDLLQANIDTWTAMVKVLQSGEHCPHHFRGQKAN